MTDINDAPTYCCDRPECQVPVVLESLVRVGKEHWCRPCWERAHPEGEASRQGSTVFEDWA